MQIIWSSFRIFQDISCKLQASRAGHLKEIHIRVLLLYNILWTFTRKVYFVLGQNGPWQNIMHIYVYEDDEEQGGGATWPVATIIIYRHILAFCIEIHRYHF